MKIDNELASRLWNKDVFDLMKGDENGKLNENRIWRGRARHGKVRPGSAWQGQGQAWRGTARLGQARQG